MKIATFSIFPLVLEVTSVKHAITNLIMVAKFLRYACSTANKDKH